MKCEDWQELILAREELQPEVQRELGQHLAKCAGCRLWKETLEELDATLTAQLRAELAGTVLTPRISRAVARERNWMNEAPELLEALGWSAVGVLAWAALVPWADWLRGHLWLAGALSLAGSLVWAGRVLWTDQSRAGRLP